MLMKIQQHCILVIDNGSVPNHKGQVSAEGFRGAFFQC